MNIQNHKYTISIPSKTFLLGEYLVLQKGAALILNTKPYFQLNISQTGQFHLSGIADNSPAGKFIHQYSTLFNGYDLAFIDPHHGAGGLGASSAQFLASYTLKQLLTNQNTNFSLPSTRKELHAAFLAHASTTGVLPPSGTDVLAQTQDKITFIDLASYAANSMIWPFEQLSFCLIRTGAKIATHEHLKQLNKVPDNHFEDYVKSAQQALQTSNALGFISAIQQYREELQNLDLTAAHTQDLLHKIENDNMVLAAKGCGAMGADVLLTIIDKNDKISLKHWCQRNNLQIVATEDDLAQGLHYKMFETVLAE